MTPRFDIGTDSFSLNNHIAGDLASTLPPLLPDRTGYLTAHAEGMPSPDALRGLARWADGLQLPGLDS